VLAKELAYYRAHFREAVQKHGVICLECGRQFKSLPQHLGKHQLSADDYKAKWGYNRTTPLERLSTRRKKRRNAIAMKSGRLVHRMLIEKLPKLGRVMAYPIVQKGVSLIQRPHERGLLRVFDRCESLRLGKNVGASLNLIPTSSPPRTIAEFYRYETEDFGQVR